MFRLSRIALVSSLAILLFAACNTESRQRVEGTLNDVESYINEHPDSALAVLQAVDSTALSTRALRARYSLLRTMALDKCYLDITAPGLLDAAVPWYEHHGSADEKMKSLYYQGRIAQDKIDRNSAAVFFARAEEYAEEVTDKHALGLLYLAEAALYDRKHNLEKEQEYAEKALTVFKEQEDPAFDSVLCQLAIVYHNKQEWHRADSLYNIALHANPIDDYTLTVVLSNYARMKALQPNKDPEGAIALLDRKQKLSGNLTPTEAGAYAYALAQTGKTAASETICANLESMTGIDRIDVLPWLMYIALLQKDYYHAYYYLAEARVLEEVNIRESLKDSVAQTLQDYFEHKAQQERVRRLQIGLWALIVLFVVLTGAFLLFLRNHHLQIERNRLLSIREELEQDLRLQEAQAASLSTDLSSRLAQLRLQLQQERLERLRKRGRLGYSIWMGQNGRSSDSAIVKTLQKEVNDVCSLEKDHRALASRLDKELDGIYSHLVEDLGISCSSDEERFLCYWLIDLKPDMIAELLNTSVNNVYVKAHRLKARIEDLNKQEYSSLFE
jgi:hypothetical protein